ncbi:hypothetical protein Bbelb_165300 [Branchiostoma belcheri]|nr:hypothetical protein Bbelb_165300 [Branchiostoma belcheri]
MRQLQLKALCGIDPNEQPTVHRDKPVPAGPPYGGPHALSIPDHLTEPPCGFRTTLTPPPHPRGFRTTLRAPPCGFRATLRPPPPRVPDHLRAPPPRGFRTALRGPPRIPDHLTGPPADSGPPYGAPLWLPDHLTGPTPPPYGAPRGLPHTVHASGAS